MGIKVVCALCFDPAVLKNIGVGEYGSRNNVNLFEANNERLGCFVDRLFHSFASLFHNIAGVDAHIIVVEIAIGRKIRINCCGVVLAGSFIVASFVRIVLYVLHQDLFPIAKKEYPSRILCAWRTEVTER